MYVYVHVTRQRFRQEARDVLSDLSKQLLELTEDNDDGVSGACVLYVCVLVSVYELRGTGLCPVHLVCACVHALVRGEWWRGGSGGVR
jgi:hypothetical protein